MTHPEELLAPYVDGTASQEERETVDAHVSSCGRCRAEIAGASAARTALKALPVIEAPPGLVPEPEEIASTGTAGAVPGWYRWGGAFAAAAAIVLLLAVILPRVGGGSTSNDRAATAAGAEGPRVPATVPMEIVHVDLGGKALSQLVSSGAQQPVPTAEATTGFDSVRPEVGTAKQAKDAATCLQTAFGNVPGTLVRLIGARFNGELAYVGLYEEGPGAGQPADTLVARAASARTCTPLSLAQARIGG